MDIAELLICAFTAQSIVLVYSAVILPVNNYQSITERIWSLSLKWEQQRFVWHTISMTSIFIICVMSTVW